MKALQDLLLIAVGSAFVNNVVLSQFLGICPFLGVSKNVKTAAGMGSAVVFVITIASFVTGLIYKFILGNPNILGGELSYLNTCHCRTGSVRRDVPEEGDAIPVQCTGRLSPIDHNKLCSTWCCPDKCTEWLLR